MNKLIFATVFLFLLSFAFAKKGKIGRAKTKVTTAKVSTVLSTQMTLLNNQTTEIGTLNRTTSTTVMSTTEQFNASELLIVTSIHELGLTCTEDNLFRALKSKSQLRFLNNGFNGLDLDVKKEVELVSQASCVAILFTMSHFKEPVAIANYIEQVFADAYFDQGVSYGNKCIILVILTYKPPIYFSADAKLSRLFYSYQLLFNAMGLNYHGILFMHSPDFHTTEKQNTEFCIPRTMAFADFVVNTMRNLAGR